MNGAEQRERQTAVARLERAFARLEDSTVETFGVEVEARQAADQQLEERLKSLFAKMVDDETTYRKSAIQNVRLELSAEIRTTNTALVVIVGLPWWKRWGWVVIGAKMLVWFPPTWPTATATATAPSVANAQSYSSEKPS